MSATAWSKNPKSESANLEIGMIPTGDSAYWYWQCSVCDKELGGVDSWVRLAVIHSSISGHLDGHKDNG